MTAPRFKLPPCGRCNGRLASDGEELYCVNCGYRPDLQRLGMSRDAMDPLRLLLHAMAFEEQVDAAIDEVDEARSALARLKVALDAFTVTLVEAKVPKKLRAVRCPKCRLKCESAQGLVSHLRSCKAGAT